MKTRFAPICACGKRCFNDKDVARQRYPKMKVYRCPLSDQYHTASKRSTRHR